MKLVMQDKCVLVIHEEGFQHPEFAPSQKRKIMGYVKHGNSRVSLLNYDKQNCTNQHILQGIPRTKLFAHRIIFVGLLEMKLFISPGLQTVSNAYLMICSTHILRCGPRKLILLGWHPSTAELTYFGNRAECKCHSSQYRWLSSKGQHFVTVTHLPVLYFLRDVDRRRHTGSHHTRVIPSLCAKTHVMQFLTIFQSFKIHPYAAWSIE